MESPGSAANSPFREAARGVISGAMAARAEAGLALAADADRVARTCHAMAARFQRGGKLLVFGNGGASADAQHVAVEFVHPVIVGKRAIPAIALTNDVAVVSGIANTGAFDDLFARQITQLGLPDDIAMGISADGSCANVVRGLEAAHRRKLLTVALCGSGGGVIARSPSVDWSLTVPSRDPLIVKEGMVTVYHILWELAHVFFERMTAESGSGAAESALEALYPFLYAKRSDPESVLAEVRNSTARKAEEIVALRGAMLDKLGDQMTECAAAIARSFAAGGKILSFGNGGSATDATAIAYVFSNPPRGRPLSAASLNADAAVLTALANDVGFENVFARQLAALSRPHDVAFGISTSGNSANLLRAFDDAKRRGLMTIGLSGYDGGRMAEANLDFIFVAPSPSVHRIQEAQTTIYNLLWELVQRAVAEQREAL